MTTDRQGNPLTGASPAAAALFDEALRRFSLYCGDPLAPLDEAVADSPAFVQAHLLRGFILALATEPAATRAARQIADAARAMPMDEREGSQLAILGQLLAADWNGAARAMDFHNMRHPRDLVALQAGHLMDFYRGNARDLRDRPARALPQWSTGVAGYHAVLAMHAFGLEEMGDYARAEEAGRRAIDLEPLDSWAHHAVAHVMEMQGRAQDGIGWMSARESHWARDDNFFRVHNWWHRALCHLDLEQFDDVLALYDGPIRGARSRVALDLVDASALLWRLHLCGRDVGDRWAELASCWDEHADGRLYPFNDVHAALACLGAGRGSRLAELQANLRAHAGGDADTSRWARDIAVPLVGAFAAFWQADYLGCLEVLHRVRFVAQNFGGSHAQRDLIDWTMTEAAIRAGRPAIALGFAQERVALKPHSAVNRALLRRAAGVAGALGARDLGP